MALDLKKAALSVGEDTVKRVIKEIVRPYAVEYITKSENKIDDILLGFMDQLEKGLLEVVDKIDGELN